MGHLSLPASKRNSLYLSLSFSPRGSGISSPSPSPCRLLDLVISALFIFVLVLTPLGDSLAASGRCSLLLSARDRDGIALAAESGRLGWIEYCAGVDADYMPCEDPRRNSGLSREMNFCRERHCPLPGRARFVLYRRRLGIGCLFGGRRAWIRCEAFSTYPRTYDFIHVTGIESLMKDPISGNNRCHLLDVMVEMDRMLRPEGMVLIRDSPDVKKAAFNVDRAVRWTATVHEQEPESHGNEQILVATKPLYKLSSASR